MLRELFLPAPLNAAYTVFRSIKFLWKGVCCLWRRKLEVEVLDALSIGVSILRGDFATAGSVMFLLNVGSLLEEWTRKKSLDDLARSMALNVDKVWVRAQGTEVLMPLTKVHPGDEIVVRSGNMIPLDGTVIEGEAMVNQAALTGESMPVRKTIGATVYAGTVVEEGECVLTTRTEGGANRYDKIVAMIEESERWVQWAACVLCHAAQPLHHRHQPQEHDQPHPRGKGSEGSGRKELKSKCYKNTGCA